MPLGPISGTLTVMSWVGDRLGVRSVSLAARGMSVERREDGLLAGLIGVAGLVEVALGAVPGHASVASSSLLVMTVALGMRRLRPRTSLALVLMALAVQSSFGVPVNAQLMTIPFVLVAAYSVGAHLDRRGSAIGLAVGATLVSAAIAAADPGSSNYGFGLVLVVGPWIAGVLVRARSAAGAEAVASAHDRVEKATGDERERIARELHDIVSHGLSAMVVQASAAAELIDRSPDAARRAMQEVQTTGTEAMMEMRHMLGLMRGSEGAGRRPQPALDDVHELIAAEQVAGRSVSLTIHGTVRELPRGLALSVFRIVQESLTNVRKHASGSSCEVTLTYGPSSLEVDIVDTGGSAPGPTSPGFGILGMRERARLYGGTIEARPRSSAGGWAVRARFPLAHETVGS